MATRSIESPFPLLRQILAVPRQHRSINRTLCLQCRRTQLERPYSVFQRTTRLQICIAATPSSCHFTTSSSSHKKSSGSSKSRRPSPSLESLTHENEKHVPDNKATRNRDAEIDPYDFSELEAGIAEAIAKLKDALVKTKDAGRVTPEMLEALDVDLNIKGADTKGGTAHKERVKIGDLASVVQKGGRMVQVFCAEEAHVKPITASLQASSYSLAPQPDANNALLISVPVPPITAETREQARGEAKKVFEKATQQIRNSRGDAQKRFRKMELAKLVIVDELHKAHKQMEEVVKKRSEDAKKVYEASLKALDG